VIEADNVKLTSLPLTEEIKGVVFDLNGDGAPCPDAFWGHFFFQTYWDIVAVDVIQYV